MTKHTILFLAANPLGTDPLALDEEARAIQEELERSGHRDKFELVTRWAVRPMDLLRDLRKLKPTVVHFSGHGGRRKPRDSEEPRQDTGPRRDAVDEAMPVNGERYGLFLQGPNGRPQFVSTAALEETFGAAGSSVQLVVLNACYSEVQAEALLAHVGCVVGMDGSIGDDAARNFAVGFYGGLGERESLVTAFKQGRAAIRLEALHDGNKPQLKVRDGIDAARFVLAATTRLSSVVRRSWILRVGIAIVACGSLAAWPLLRQRTDPPPITVSSQPANAAPPGLLAQSRATIVGEAHARLVEPTLALPSTPRDCKRADAASPMCGYRGTLRKMNGTPISNTKIELMGTDCTNITNDMGVFDFKTCDPNQTRRLRRPNIFLHLPDNHICREIPLQWPPLVTEVRIDLKTCQTLTRTLLVTTRIDPQVQCRYWMSSFCKRLYACSTSIELVANGFPTSESDCISQLQAVCKSDALQMECFNEHNYCASSIRDLSCSEVRKTIQLGPLALGMPMPLGLPIPDSLP